MTLAAGHYSAFDRSRFRTDRASVVPSSDHIRNRIEAATGDVIGVAALGRNDRHRQFDIDNTVRASRHALYEGLGRHYRLPDRDRSAGERRQVEP